MSRDHIHPLSSEIGRLSAKIAAAPEHERGPTCARRDQLKLRRRMICRGRGGYAEQLRRERRIAIESGMPDGAYRETEADEK